jgi:tetratricopeptide (TPR) repeat protein
VTALTSLAQLELGQANGYLQQAQAASLAQSQAGIGAPFRPSGGKLAQALANDPIASAEASQASAQLQSASTNYRAAASRTMATYQQIVKLQPKSQEALFALAQAGEQLREYKAAVGAYEKLLKFSLDPATKKQIRVHIKALRQAGG